MPKKIITREETGTVYDWGKTTPIGPFSIPKGLWLAARAKSRRTGIRLSWIVIRELERWVIKDPKEVWNGYLANNGQRPIR